MGGSEVPTEATVLEAGLESSKGRRVMSKDGEFSLRSHNGAKIEWLG
jgi:hypothetical protein